jgi:glycosyltransferase involved in cell wall biosynthesis
LTDPYNEPDYDPAVTNGLRRIGINAVFLEARMGGLETYVRELVPALLEARPDLELRVYASARGKRLLEREPWAGEVALVNHPLLGVPGTRAALETTYLGRLATRDRLDVLHNVALTAPLRTRPANVLLLADVTWLREPETVGRARAALWRTLVLPATRRADRIITLSEAARREIVEDLQVPVSRVDVVPLGHGLSERAGPTPERELRNRLELGFSPIVLAVSALTPHKNVRTLLDAIALVRETHPDVRLVIPGNPSAHGAELERHARGLGLEETVRFPGWASETDLEGLYRAAVCFVFPSLREGFGLPILEAMARDLPVAVADASALPEVAGDAALYFDPRDPRSMATTITRLLDDGELRARLVELGRVRTRAFTWQRTAEETLRSFERARAGR